MNLLVSKCNTCYITLCRPVRFLPYSFRLPLTLAYYTSRLILIISISHILCPTRPRLLFGCEIGIQEDSEVSLWLSPPALRPRRSSVFSFALAASSTPNLSILVSIHALHYSCLYSYGSLYIMPLDIPCCKVCSELGARETNYNIAASVNTLTLCCHPQTLEDSTSGTLMSTILRRLPHIRNFALEAGFDGIFSEEFASAIRALCRSPNLTTLYLNSIRGFPSTAIMECPNLQSLRLRCVTAFEINFIFPALFAMTHYFSVRQHRRGIKLAVVISRLLGH